MLFLLSARIISASSSALSSTSRITRSFIIAPLLSFERKRKRRSLAFCALRRDSAAVAPDDPLNRRQSHPGARELGDGMKPLEGTEQFFGICHVEAGPIIADEIDLLAILIGGRELNFCPHRLAGELPRVADQIFKHQ